MFTVRLTISKQFMFVIAILCLLPGAAAAQEGAFCTFYSTTPTYLYFDENRHISDTIDWYTDSSCSVPGGEWEVPADGWVLKVTEEDAVAACKAALGGSNEVVKQFDLYPEFPTFNQQDWQCHNTPKSKPVTSSRRRRPSSSWPPPPDPRPTGLQLNEDIDLLVSAVSGLYSGIQFQRVGPEGVGQQSVLDIGFHDAVDVWGIIGIGYEVCFPRSGLIIFLDAATSPRSVLSINYFTRDGYTCAYRERAGTIVLVPGEVITDDSVIEPQTCLVTPRPDLNLRATPWGEILSAIPAGTAVPAQARTGSWFNVTYEGIEGWVAAWLADSVGDCDWTV